MYRYSAIGLFIAVASSALISAPEKAEAQAAIAVQHDVAPGTGGGTYSFFGPSSLNDVGDVTFEVSLSGSIATSGIFVESLNGGSRVVALRGDAPPGSIGGTFSFLAGPRINNSGQVVLLGQIASGTASEGIFLETSPGVIVPVAIEGDPAPGPGGGTFTSFNVPSINDSGQVAFLANTVGGTSGGGIFSYTGSVGTAIGRRTDPIPPVVGGTLLAFSDPDINSNGDVAFLALIDTPGGITSGVALSSGGTLVATTVEGDPILGATGFNYDGFVNDRPSINASSEIVYTAALLDGPIAGLGVIVDAGPTDVAVALSNDLEPTGGTYFQFPFDPDGNDAGDIAFRATIVGGAASEALFIMNSVNIAPVALIGEVAPGTGGGTYSSFRWGPSINAQGNAAYGAFVTGGTTSRGIFVPEPEGALPMSLGVIALVLLRCLKDQKMAVS